MKQYFDTDAYEFFKNYFQLRAKPSELETAFFEKTKKYVGYLQWIPGLRLVMVGNSLAMNGASSDSDIDLYIVTEKHRMWFVRIIITIMFQLLGVRKTAKKHAGRFCLSFFSTTEAMDFSDFALEKDIYLYYWCIYAKPILSYNDSYELFLEKNNWIDMCGYETTIEENKRCIAYKKNKKASSKVFFYLDALCKKIFLPKTLTSYERLGKPFGVIISDDMLKFHDKDIRKKVQKEYEKNVGNS